MRHHKPNKNHQTWIYDYIRVSIIFTYFSLSTLSTLAQITITVKNNKPKMGDKIERYAIEGMSCDGKGENVLWNFSDCNILDTRIIIKFKTDTLGYKSVEPGLYKHYIQEGNQIWMYAYKSSLATLNYSKPQITIIYPLHYGDSISSPFSGQGLFCNTYKLTHHGNKTIKADATGKIILPDKSLLSDVLRLHIITTKDVLLEGLNSNFTDSATAKTEVSEEYLWFVKGCRYPIFEHYINTSYGKGKVVASTTDSYCYLPDSILERAIPYDTWYLNKETYLSDSSTNNQDNISNYINYHITTKDKVVYISYDTFINTNVNFIVANTTGMVYQNKTFHCSKGDMYNITFNFSGYQPGEYIIHINVNGKVENEKVLIK